VPLYDRQKRSEAVTAGLSGSADCRPAASHTNFDSRVRSTDGPDDSEKEIPVKTDERTKVKAALALMALAVLLAPRAKGCSSPNRLASSGFHPAPRVALTDPPEPPSGTLPSLSDADPSPAGLWKTVFQSGGTVVMVGFDTWHSDGTELALDGLFPPATGNVCPGVWIKTGPRTYATMHPAFEYDPAGINVVAIFIERVQVTISQDGRTFQGTFTWDSYTFDGNLMPGSLAGAITGSRISVDAQFPFPFPL
jgi:hypothetical protein